jgi:hypothetical protein
VLVRSRSGSDGAISCAANDRFCIVDTFSAHSCLGIYSSASGVSARHRREPKYQRKAAAMAAKHIELIVETYTGVDAKHLQERLHHGGIETMPMKVGLLLAGEVSSLRAAIPSLTGEEQDDITVPEYLKDAVKAIRIVKPRSLH